MASTQDDAQLMARIAQGDAGAFEALVDRHANRYLALGVRLLGDRMEAEDMVQEAFTMLWTRPDRFDPSRAKFSTWFYRVVTNRCLDAKRKRRPEALPENYDAPDDRVTAEAGLIDQDRDNALETALDDLPERQRTAVTLCYLQGLSNQDAADILELNIKALESLLTRGRRKLRDLLGSQRQELLQGEHR